MKRKNNWNLLGVITLIAMCAFMFISCQQGPTLNPYKTLTLDIEGQQQKLYYGDGAWYSKLSDNGLLLDENKVTGDDVKFTISETTKWTVTFKKNIPNGASESDFTITPASVDVTSELRLSPDNFIDKTTGKVSVDSISEDVTVTGKYPPTAIGQDVTASSTNANYEFAGWTVKGVTIDNIADYKVSGDTEVVANWNCLADLKVLTVKDGDVVKDTAYYNLTDSKWYADENMTGEKTSVIPPEVQEKPYTITIDYENGTPDDIRTVTSSFLGYGVGSEVKVQAGGSLSGYTINEDTELVFLWSEEKITEPSQPTKDGYMFNGWYNGEKSYDFNSVVTGDMTLTAHWKEKPKKLTVKDGNIVKDTAWYKSEDNKWYANENMTGEKTSVATPQDKTYTITLNYDNDTPNGSEPVTSSFLGYGLDGNTNPVIEPDGLLKDYTIENDTVFVSKWDKVKFTKPSDPTKDGYTFDKWYKDGSPYDFNSVVTGDMTLVAHWKEKLKKLTVKDGVNEIDTAWYSREDNKWYEDENMTGEKTSVRTPQDKTYTITLNYDNGSSNGSGTATSSFSGYEDGSEVKVQVNGLLSGYTINSETTLFAKWSDAKFEEPSDKPTKDGYNFDAWYKDGTPYDFNSVVTGDMTLTAHWKEKLKKLTVKDGEEPVDTAWYNSEDTKWYADENMTGEKTTVRTPQDKTYTITLNYDNGSSNGSGTATSSFSGYEDGSEVKVQANGLLSGYTINSDTTLFAKWSKEKYSEPSQPTRDGYVFNGWYNGESLYNFDSVVEGNMTLTAHWTKKTFNTLTLDIAGQQQKLYYGSDNAWYSDVVVKGEDQLLLVDNKVTGENIKFNIPSDPTWTVTFNKNTPAGAKDNEISISRESVEVVPELSLSPNNVIDITTGEVLKSSISENVIVTGTYPPKAIGQDKDITASSTNKNYEFDKWTTEGGEEITDITSYPVSGNITIKATWNNISDFKVLAVKDGDKIVETVYYYTDGKWYKERSTTSEVITSVALPDSTTKTYTITLDYDNDGRNETRSEPVTSSFRGYGLDGNTNPVIEPDGLLKDYTIENDTVLVSKWSEAKITKPENPTRDGYVFNGWYNGDDEYSFDSVVTGDMTLVAHWKEKPKKLTVKDGVNEQDTAWYSREDNKWYADENMTGEKTSVKLPEVKEKEYTITFNTDGGSTVDPVKVTSSFLGYGVGSEVKVPSNGSLSGCTISDATVLVSLWSEAKFNEPSQPTKDGYVFDGWYNGESPYNFGNVVTGNMTLTAHWTQKTYKTLTLNIGENNYSKVLYYGSDNAWYKALSEGGLLLDANKVTGDDVKFNIPELVWKVTFDKNAPNGASESAFTITPASVDVTPDLTLTPDNTVDASSGKVKVENISENVTVIGTYPPTAIGASVTHSTDNENYEFAGWTVNDVTIDNITTYAVSGNITIKATWKNISSFKVLTVKDGGVVKDTAYYNTKDHKWYAGSDITSGEKPSVPTLPNREYTITLNYDNGSDNGSEKVTSSFRGYGDGSEVKVPSNGSLSAYTIDKDTELVSLWSEAKFNEPSDKPTKDGYVFEAWYNGENPYSFDNVVTGNMTLTAHWKEKPKKLTVKDGVNEIDTAWFYTIDKKWYANENMTEEKTSVRTLPNREYTVTLNYDNKEVNPTRSEKVPSSFRGYGTNDNTSPVIGTDGLLSAYTINDATELVSLWSEVKFNEPSEQPTKDGYVFEAWYNGEEPYDFNSVVTGDITITAHWTKKTYKTLTLNITDSDGQTLYYGSDNVWYKALGEGDLLLDRNKVTGDVKFNIPEAPTWTLTLNKNRPQNAPFSDDAIILSQNQLTLYPKDGVFSTDEYISKDGIVKVPSITGNVDVTLDTSRRYPSENVEATISRDDIKFLGWKIGDQTITDLSTYEVTADNISLNASWGYKASIGALDSPNNGVHNADRGFYTEREEIDDYVKDKSKQKRVAYYAKGERVRLFYNESMMHGLVRINLKNEWSGETKQITPSGSYYNEYVLVNIDMPNQPLSISFEVIAGGEPV